MKGVSVKHSLNPVRPTPRSPQKIMSRGHSHASETLASRACRNTSGIADCARWRSAVVFVAFPCLFPLHIAATAAHSSECPQSLLAMALFSHSRFFRSSLLNHALVIARRSRPIRDTAPCDKDSLPAPLLRVRCLDAEVLLSKWKVSQSENSSYQRSRKHRNITF